MKDPSEMTSRELEDAFVAEVVEHDLNSPLGFDVVLFQAEDWCRRHNTGCSMIGVRLEWDGDDDPKQPYFASVGAGHDKRLSMGAAFDTDFRRALMRASISAARGLVAHNRARTA